MADKPRVGIAKVGAALSALGGSTWDLAQDGKRVVVVTRVDSASAPQEHEVVLVLNFFDELRRRVPLGK